MERLTDKQFTGYVNCGIYQAIQKLAHYEDLEEQGMLIKLDVPIYGVDSFRLENGEIFQKIPVRIGDTVFVIEMNYHTKIKMINKRKVTRIALSESEVSIFTDYRINRGVYGKTVFLTEQEAKEALERMKK